MSDLLKSQDSNLNQAIDSSLRSYGNFEAHVKEVQLEIGDKKLKDKITKILESAKIFKKEQGKVFDLITKTNKSLYRIVE